MALSQSSAPSSDSRTSRVLPVRMRHAVRMIRYDLHRNIEHPDHWAQGILYQIILSSKREYAGKQGDSNVADVDRNASFGLKHYYVVLVRVPATFQQSATAVFLSLSDEAAQDHSSSTATDQPHQHTLPLKMLLQKAPECTAHNGAP